MVCIIEGERLQTLNEPEFHRMDCVLLNIQIFQELRRCNQVKI
jgi:hypothetical protein